LESAPCVVAKQVGFDSEFLPCDLRGDGSVGNGLAPVKARDEEGARKGGRGVAVPVEREGKRFEEWRDDEVACVDVAVEEAALLLLDERDDDGLSDHACNVLAGKSVAHACPVGVAKEARERDAREEFLALDLDECV
jgi:hypothetical protein